MAALRLDRLVRIKARLRIVVCSMRVPYLRTRSLCSRQRYEIVDGTSATFCPQTFHMEAVDPGFAGANELSRTVIAASVCIRHRHNHYAMATISRLSCCFQPRCDSSPAAFSSATASFRASCYLRSRKHGQRSRTRTRNPSKLRVPAKSRHETDPANQIDLTDLCLSRALREAAGDAWGRSYKIDIDRWHPGAKISRASEACAPISTNNPSNNRLKLPNASSR